VWNLKQAPETENLMECTELLVRYEQIGNQPSGKGTEKVLGDWISSLNAYYESYA